MLKPELGASLGPERLLREIRVAPKLQDPHIVGLLDSGVVPSGHRTEAVTCPVMPYIEGEALRERLGREQRHRSRGRNDRGKRWLAAVVLAAGRSTASSALEQRWAPVARRQEGFSRIVVSALPAAGRQ